MILFHQMHSKEGVSTQLPQSEIRFKTLDFERDPNTPPIIYKLLGFAGQLLRGDQYWRPQWVTASTDTSDITEQTVKDYLINGSNENSPEALNLKLFFTSNYAPIHFFSGNINLGKTLTCPDDYTKLGIDHKDILFIGKIQNIKNVPGIDPDHHEISLFSLRRLWIRVEKHADGLGLNSGIMISITLKDTAHQLRSNLTVAQGEINRFNNSLSKNVQILK